MGCWYHPDYLCLPLIVINLYIFAADITKFYSTPVNVTTPLDSLKTADLPPNLNIQYEYHRFHPGKNFPISTNFLQVSDK